MLCTYTNRYSYTPKQVLFIPKEARLLAIPAVIHPLACEYARSVPAIHPNELLLVLLMMETGEIDK